MCLYIDYHYSGFMNTSDSGIFRILGVNTMSADALAPQVASTSNRHGIGCVRHT